MKYNLIHTLFFIETNLSNIYYSLYAPLLDTIVKGDSNTGVSFSVHKDVSRPGYLTQKFDYFWVNTDSSVIYYEHPILPGLTAKLILDMSAEKYSITVNDAYYKLSRYRFENVWPPGQHLTNLITIKLLQNNILTLHSAAFYNKKTKDGYIVLGASNTGKSRTTFAALEKGYGYHSEDLTILDKDYIYTTPLISAQSSMLPNKSMSLRYNLLVNNLTGINTIIPRISTVTSFRQFFSNHDVTVKSKPRKIFILEKGTESIHKLSSGEAQRKILILNRLELTYSRDHLFLTYSYFNKNLDVERLLQVEKNILQQVIDKTECYLVKSLTPDKYITLIQKVL